MFGVVFSFICSVLCSLEMYRRKCRRYLKMTWSWVQTRDTFLRFVYQASFNEYFLLLMLCLRFIYPQNIKCCIITSMYINSFCQVLLLGFHLWKEKLVSSSARCRYSEQEPRRKPEVGSMSEILVCVVSWHVYPLKIAWNSSSSNHAPT